MKGWLAAVWIVAVGTANVTAQEESPRELLRAEPELAPFGLPLHGSVSARMRVRWTGDETDQDLYEILSADLGDRERHTVTAHLFLRAAEDIDGNRDRSGYYVFDSLTDTYKSSFNARFYSGYVDLHRLGPLELARLGRQIDWETPVLLHYDGVRAESKRFDSLLGLKVGLYGGVPVHLYESSPSGDVIFGGYAEVRPWRGGRVRLDAARIRDEYTFGVSRDDLLSLGLWQGLGPKLLLHYRHTILEGESRDLNAQVLFQEPDWDFQARLSYYQLLETQRVLSIDLDYFFSAAKDYFPYGQVRFTASKGFGDHFSIEAGIDWRELRHQADDAPFNREFRRYYVTPSLSNWPIGGMTVSLTLDYWDALHTTNGDNWALGGEIVHRLTPEFKLTVGTAYALYKYDYYLDQEREDVQTTYVRATYNLKGVIKVDVSYEYENGDFEDVHTLKFGATKSF